MWRVNCCKCDELIVILKRRTWKEVWILLKIINLGNFKDYMVDNVLKCKTEKVL